MRMCQPRSTTGLFLHMPAPFKLSRFCTGIKCPHTEGMPGYGMMCVCGKGGTASTEHNTATHAGRHAMPCHAMQEASKEAHVILCTAHALTCHMQTPEPPQNTEQCIEWVCPLQAVLLPAVAQSHLQPVAQRPQALLPQDCEQAKPLQGAVLHPALRKLLEVRPLRVQDLVELQQLRHIQLQFRAGKAGDRQPLLGALWVW